MAKTLKSPGQKRRSRIRIIVAILALLALSPAWFLKGPEQKAAIALSKSHEAAVATVSNLWSEEEEYRNFKGKRRHRTQYYVTYSFNYGDESYEQTQAVDHGTFNQLDGQETAEVWFAASTPDDSELALVVQSHAKASPMARVFGLGKFVIPAALALYYLLTFLFGREPKGYLPEGFYTENSWLDVEDGELVALDDTSLIRVSLNKKRIDEVQKVYQQGASVQAIIDMAQGKVTRIALDAITEVSSDHYSDTLSISYKDGEESKSTSIEFLNATVKQHALEKLAQRLPKTLMESEKHFGRLQAAAPGLIFGALLFALVYFYLESVILIAIAGFAILFSLKVAIPRLFDPTKRRMWKSEAAA